MAIWVFIALLLSMSGYSSATYCVCKPGGDDNTYQKALDYACGNGADCTPILQGGPCFEPDTVKDHCDYAVNSYFQKSGQAQDSCNFAGVAAPVNALPTTVSSGCTYPASPSQAGSSSTGAGGGITGSPTAGTTGSPTTGTTGSTTGSTTGGTTGSTTGSTTGGTTGTVFGPGSTGLAPTGLGFNDSSAAAAASGLTTFLQLILAFVLMELNRKWIMASDFVVDWSLWMRF